MFDGTSPGLIATGILLLRARNRSRSRRPSAVVSRFRRSTGQGEFRVDFGCKVGEVGSAIVFDGLLWPFEASGFQVRAAVSVSKVVHDVIILQFVSRLKVE